MFDGTKSNDKYQNSKRIYLQAKNGNVSINGEDYAKVLKNDGDEMWLITSRGIITLQSGETIQQQIVKITKKESGLFIEEMLPISNLVEFVFDDRKKAILPKKISIFLDLFN